MNIEYKDIKSITVVGNDECDYYDEIVEINVKNIPE